MAEEISDLPTEEVKVGTAPSSAKTTVGSKEFIQEFITEIKSGSQWRTPASLANKLGVDAVDLVKWMDKVPDLARKPSKEDGVYYYGIAFNPTTPDDKEKKKKLTRPVLKEEDRYVTGFLHSIYGQLYRTLDKYAIRIHDLSPEAFTALLNARDRLSAGLVLFQNVTNTDVEKLPKL